MATSESILVSKFLFHLKKVRTEIEEKFSKAHAVLKKREEERKVSIICAIIN